VKVICIGSTSQDIFFPTDEYTTIETPEDLTAKSKALFEIGGKFRVADRFEAVGGVASNVSIGLSRQGIATACLSVIGDDRIGSWCQSELEQNKVDTTLITIKPETKTEKKVQVEAVKAPERIIFHNRDANEKLVVKAGDLAQTEWVFISALNGHWKQNLKCILDQATAHHLKIAFNPGQHNLREDPDLVLNTLKQTDLLCLNKDEATELLLTSDTLTMTEKHDGINDEAILIRGLHRAGAKIISLTDGTRGAWASDGHSLYHADILTHVTSIDMTGAGDAFASAFFGATLSGLSLETALRHGIGNGGSVVKHYGAIEGLLSSSDLEIFTKDVHIEKLR
jgi:sugar/nucleoside kinase (ribokinase family)